MQLQDDIGRTMDLRVISVDGVEHIAVTGDLLLRAVPGRRLLLDQLLETV